MKPTKILHVSFICLSFMLSCKKDQAPDPLISEEKPLTQDIKNETPLTEISLENASHDFGDIKKNDVVEYTYTIKNIGQNPLIISSVQPSCGCTAPDYTKEPILPGETGTVTLKFDSSGFDGKINKSADVFANTEESPIKLLFTANIKN